MISWILPEKLAIADYNDVMTSTHDVNTVFVDARLFFDDKEGKPIWDAYTSLWNEIVFIIHNLQNMNRKVIVFCDAGLDRSPFIVAMVLYELIEGLEFEDAYKLIKEKRPAIIEHYEWKL